MSEVTELHCARLGQAPELKTLGGKEVVEFSVAVNEGYGDKKETRWYSVTSGNKKLVDLIDKGCLVYVRGRLKTKQVGDKTYRNLYTNSYDDVVVYTFKQKSADEPPPPL